MCGNATFFQLNERQDHIVFSFDLWFRKQHEHIWSQLKRSQCSISTLSPCHLTTTTTDSTQGQINQKNNCEIHESIFPYQTNFYFRSTQTHMKRMFQYFKIVRQYSSNNAITYKTHHLIWTRRHRNISFLTNRQSNPDFEIGVWGSGSSGIVVMFPAMKHFFYDSFSSSQKPPL